MLSATGSARHRCCAALMFAALAACMCTPLRGVDRVSGHYSRCYADLLQVVAASDHFMSQFAIACGLLGGTVMSTT